VSQHPNAFIAAATGGGVERRLTRFDAVQSHELPVLPLDIRDPA
jgi:hypothetical protein